MIPEVEIKKLKTELARQRREHNAEMSVLQGKVKNLTNRINAAVGKEKE